MPCGTRLARRSFVFVALPYLFKGELVGHVVFVNIPDVGDGFLPDVFRRHQFDIVEPDVRVETPLRGLLAQPRNAIRPRVIAGEHKQSFVHGVYVLIIEVSICNVPHSIFAAA
jgi:hypothetical protein